MNQEILRYPAVAQATGLSRTTLWRLERLGLFPSRRQLSSNTVGWPRAEVLAWAASRPVASQGPQNKRRRGRKTGGA